MGHRRVKQLAKPSRSLPITSKGICADHSHRLGLTLQHLVMGEVFVWAAEGNQVPCMGVKPLLMGQATLGILAGLGSLRLMRLPRAKTMSRAGGEGHTTPENVENKKM